MDEAELEQLSEELYRLIKAGPGADAIALARVEAIASRFEEASGHSYVREKTREVVHDFRLWFSPRKWQRYGAGGSNLRGMLYADISKLHDAMASFGSQ